MKRFATSILVLTSLICGPALAQSARPADSEVEKLIQQVEGSAQVFERALDKDLKKAIVRSPSGEMEMKSRCGRHRCLAGQGRAGLRHGA